MARSPSAKRVAIGRTDKVCLLYAHFTFQVNVKADLHIYIAYANTAEPSEHLFEARSCSNCGVAINSLFTILNQSVCCEVWCSGLSSTTRKQVYLEK